MVLKSFLLLIWKRKKSVKTSRTLRNVRDENLFLLYLLDKKSSKRNLYHLICIISSEGPILIQVF